MQQSVPSDRGQESLDPHRHVTPAVIHDSLSISNGQFADEVVNMQGTLLSEKHIYVYIYMSSLCP